MTVDSAGYTDYVFQVDLPAGVHTIGVSFLNDAYNPGVEDRNLYLDRVNDNIAARRRYSRVIATVNYACKIQEIKMQDVTSPAFHLQPQTYRR